MSLLADSGKGAGQREEDDFPPFEQLLEGRAGEACAGRSVRSARASGRRGSLGQRKLRRRRRYNEGRRAHTVGLGGVPGARQLQVTRRQLQQILTGGDAAARCNAARGLRRASDRRAQHGRCRAASGSEEKASFKHTASADLNKSARKMRPRFA